MSTASTVSNQKVELIAADTALLSLRSSGHDYCSAVGEVIDNSLQANANNIRCQVFTEKKRIGNNKRATEVVVRQQGEDWLVQVYVSIKPVTISEPCHSGVYRALQEVAHKLADNHRDWPGLAIRRVGPREYDLEVEGFSFRLAFE